jgi:hypothetical protein
VRRVVSSDDVVNEPEYCAFHAVPLLRARGHCCNSALQAATLEGLCAALAVSRSLARAPHTSQPLTG